MNTNDDIGWFAELAKHIDEKAVVTMMVIGKARSVSLLMASNAADPDTYAEAIFPHVLQTLTALVGNQVNCEAIKADYRETDQMRQNLAAMKQATADWQREQQRAKEAHEQNRRAWGQR